MAAQTKMVDNRPNRYNSVDAHFVRITDLLAVSRQDRSGGLPHAFEGLRSTETQLRKDALTLLHKAFSIIKEHRRAFIVFNLVLYGLFLLGMVVTVFFPELQDHSRGRVDQILSQPGFMKTVADAYVSRNVLVAISLTFLINLAVALCLTTLPSFVVPFVGILVVSYRAVAWGFLFSPIGPDRAALIPHALTLVIEGQAYVLAAFAAYVHGRMFLWPSRYGLESRRAGYKAGGVATVRLYVLVALTLLIGGAYEGIEVIYLVPLFI